jgi:hypothetical protein
MSRWLLRAAIAVVILGVPLLVVRREQVWWWIEIHTGTVNEVGPYYGFWSGFGSDLGEYGLLTSMFTSSALLWRHHTCHRHWWCWRHPLFALHGSPYLVCANHHPDDQLTAGQAVEQHVRLTRRPR